MSNSTKKKDKDIEELYKAASLEKAPLNAAAPADNTTPQQQTPWSGLEEYLKSNNIEYDKSNIIGANDAIGKAYAAKQIDDRALSQGENLYTRAYKDFMAQQAKNKAVADADNSARQATAYNDYLSKKLASYLQEVQGANGLEGYDGVTKGQAISLANMERNSQAEVLSARDTAKSDALSQYQNALYNSQSEYQAEQKGDKDALDARVSNETVSGKNDIDTYIANINKNGSISETQFNEAKAYIDKMNINNEAKENVKNYLDATYSSYKITDDEQKARETATVKTEISGLTRENFDNTLSTWSADKKAQYKADIDAKRAELYPKGKGAKVATAKYNANGSYTFNFDGVERTYQERADSNPMGSGTGTINKKEAEKWGLPNPDDYSYKDVLRVEYNGKSVYYVKRAGAWYALGGGAIADANKKD